MKTSNIQKIAVLFLLIFSFQAVFPMTQKRAPVKAPAWKLSDVQGKKISSDDFKGKVVIIDFWATWCPPCRAEIPGFIELQKKYKEKGLVVIGISLDQGTPENIQSFIKEFKINYPVVMGSEKVVADFGLSGAIPETFIIDRKGNVVGNHVGFTESTVFEKEILRRL